jgi:hypothetical protein
LRITWNASRIAQLQKLLLEILRIGMHLAVAIRKVRAQLQPVERRRTRASVKHLAVERLTPKPESTWGQKKKPPIGAQSPAREIVDDFS